MPVRWRGGRGGQLLNGTPTRVRQPEELGHFVERLTHGVIARLPELLIASPCWHIQQQRVPATHEKGGERWRRVGVFEQRREQMPFEMMHGHDGLAMREGERLRVARANQQRANQARRMRHRDGVNVAQRKPGVVQRAVHRGHDAGEMLAARNLGHHATEEPVYILRQNHQPVERHALRGTRHHRRRRFVAAGFNAENDRTRLHYAQRTDYGAGSASSCSSSRLLPGEFQSSAPTHFLRITPSRPITNVSGMPVVR